LNYKTSFSSTNSGGAVTGTFGLPAGDYTILVGGNDIANKTADTALLPHGLAITLSVTPSPPLTIAQKVFVAWPSQTAENWLLQSASSITGIWSIVTNAPVHVDGQFGVVLQKGAGEQFFRFSFVP